MGFYHDLIEYTAKTFTSLIFDADEETMNHVNISLYHHIGSHAYVRTHTPRGLKTIK